MRAEMPIDASHGPTTSAAMTRRPSRRTLTASAIAVLAAAVGVAWILIPASSESTDDAYVAVDATTVAPKVRGLVADVFIRDNETVRAGAPLVRIDAAGPGGTNVVRFSNVNVPVTIDAPV